MPGVDGIEATRRLLAKRPQSRSSCSPIVSASSRPWMRAPWATCSRMPSPRSCSEASRPRPEVNRRWRQGSRGRAHGAGREQAGRADRTRTRGVLAEGLANTQLARGLGIADKTVKAHLTDLFQSIGVTDRTQAALWARNQGIAKF